MKHLEIALEQIGVKEIAGEQDNPEVLKYFTEIGFDGEKLKDETAWCSAFINWVMKRSALPYSGALNARSWLNIGNEVVGVPKLGDVVVFWRESPDSWKGHVGLFIAERDGYIYCLGGNQNNQVNIKPYPKNRLLKYRRMII